MTFAFSSFPHLRVNTPRDEKFISGIGPASDDIPASQRSAFVSTESRAIVGLTRASIPAIEIRPLRRANVAQWQSNGFVNRRSVVRSHSLAPLLPITSHTAPIPVAQARDLLFRIDRLENICKKL